MKKSLIEKDNHYHNELLSKQTKTDRDILELRRTMDKIDMVHHERFEKLVRDHEDELGNILIYVKCSSISDFFKLQNKSMQKMRKE